MPVEGSAALGEHLTTPMINQRDWIGTQRTERVTKPVASSKRLPCQRPSW
jgi:hypothetical protein